MSSVINKLERRIFDLIATSIIDVFTITNIVDLNDKLELALPFTKPTDPENEYKFSFVIPDLGESRNIKNFLILDTTGSGILYSHGEELGATDPGHRAIEIPPGCKEFVIKVTSRGFFGLHPWYLRIDGIYVISIIPDLLDYSLTALNLFDLFRTSADQEVRANVQLFLNKLVSLTTEAPSIKQIAGTSLLVMSGMFPVIGDEGSSSPSPENNLTNIFHFLQDVYGVPVLKGISGYGSKDIEINRSMEILKFIKQYFLEVSGTNAGEIKQTEMYLLGHSHIDAAWLWPFSETKRKVNRTFINVASYLESNNSFVYAQSSAIFLKWISSMNPNLLERIKKLEKIGKWIPVGGMWVESDTNLLGGESLVRQFTFGQKMFKSIFGRICNIGWLPDSFGYSGQLPQIMKKSGINYFVLSKLMMNDTNEFPYHLFTWVGIDGSEMPTSILNTDYNGTMKYSEVLESYQKFKGKDKSFILYTFGYGDGGGGPTRGMLASIEKGLKLPWIPKLINLPEEESIIKKVVTKDKPSFYGDLYLEGHRGVYTTNSTIKLLVSLLEDILRKTDMIFSLFLEDYHKYGYENILQNLWETVLKNEFHDVLPGSSILDVYNQAESEIKDALSKATSLMSGVISSRIGKTTVLNATQWEFYGYLNLDPNSETIPELNPKSLMEGSDLRNLVAVRIPAMSAVPIEKALLSAEHKNGNDMVVMTTHKNNTIEVTNGMLTVKINQQKGSFDLYDESGKKVLAQNVNKRKIYFDEPSELDAWEIDRDTLTENNEIKYSEIKLAIEIDTPNVVAISIRTDYEDSSHLSQLLVLRRGFRSLEIRNFAYSSAQQRLFKLYMEPNIDSKKLQVSIPYGSITREVLIEDHNNASFEFPGLHWVDISDGTRGVAFLSSNLHGYSFNDEGLGVTLARFPIFPNPWSDASGAFSIIHVIPHKGDFTNSEFQRTVGTLINKPTVIKSDSNKVKTEEDPINLQEEPSFPFEVKGDDIIVGAIKPADNVHALVLRLYNATDHESTCKVLSTQKLQIVETDILENVIADPVLLPTEIKFNPFEIKTLLIYPFPYNQK